MASASAFTTSQIETSTHPKPPIQLEVHRIRDLSRTGHYAEALASAEALAVAAPDNRDALYLIAANQRCLHRVEPALATLRGLEERYPRFSLLYQERGHCYTTLGDKPLAIESFSRAVSLNPALSTSWAMLERLCRVTGQVENAGLAARQLAALQQLPPDIVRAGSLFSDGDLAAAETLLDAWLQPGRAHSEALRLAGRIKHRYQRLEEAERLLGSALKLAPTYRAARLDYIRVLLDRQKFQPAQDETQALLSVEPDSPECLLLHSGACAGLGQHERAVELYRRLLAGSPDSAELHTALGHSLQSIGLQQEAIEAFRAAAKLRPGFGDAWWSLANLKTYRFSDGEMARMRSEEAVPSARSEDRCGLCFALGKACEDRGEYAESWRFYERGNAHRRAESLYRPEITEAGTRRQLEVCTPEFFAAREGAGAPDPDPIFIVGLPRSGSTLLEQILASHSRVQGTQELPDIPRIAAELDGDNADTENSRDLDSAYPGVLAGLAPEEFRRLGERYLADTRPFRGDRPFFIDKMPNNFRHIGLIHLMLPNARIIDARREPMACCFSNLKQLFAGGQEFAYSVEDIARYYRSYLDLMHHWHAVLPGRVLRVCYEDLVNDLEGNVRRVLDFCGLEFEPACVEFHKSARSVRTPSSEQVRRPIFRDGLNQWRNYEVWLGPLKDALGDALVRYRE